jgi:hypothetical protein
MPCAAWLRHPGGIVGQIHHLTGIVIVTCLGNGLAGFVTRRGRSF